ncbi:hypothetical protein FACS189415_8080 [Bacteroidia bacterium]|nr:hypothetical protein FACS189415_8080 [Bacteroidia bacterium]
MKPKKLLPMFRKFTLNEIFIVVNDNRRILHPKKQTLSLIKQFAGSYHVEKKMPQTLNAMVLS